MVGGREGKDGEIISQEGGLPWIWKEIKPLKETNLGVPLPQLCVDLKWFYDENCVFPIIAILMNKKRSVCVKKNAVYYIQISLFVPEIFKFLKYAN